MAPFLRIVGLDDLLPLLIQVSKSAQSRKCQHTGNNDLAAPSISSLQKITFVNNKGAQWAFQYLITFCPEIAETNIQNICLNHFTLVSKEFQEYNE